MNTFASPNKRLSNISSLLTGALLLLVSSLVLQGCGSSNSTPVVDANPNGYYTGTATVKEEADNTTDLQIDDIQVLINGDRIMVMSKAEALLYDARITDITGNNYTANVTIFFEGENPVNTTLSGTITEGEGITGTFAGTGFGNGGFDVSYDDSNSDTSSVTDIAISWSALLNESTGTPLQFTVEDSGNILHIDNSLGSIFNFCRIESGSASSIVSTNLFDIEISFNNCKPAVDSSNSGIYTGLATAVLKPNPVQGEPDDLTFVMMFANPSFSGVSNAIEFINN